MKTRADSGRKGGLVTLERYGRDQLADWGRLGGRPRNLSYDEIRQQRRLEQSKNNHKEVTGPSGTSNLGTLKTLYKLRSGSRSIETEPAGTTEENPTEAAPARKDAT